MTRKEDLFSEQNGEIGGYVKATTDTGFKNMISDDKVATALINDVFHDMKVIDPHKSVEIVGKGETKIPLQRKESNATMDYHAIIDYDDHVIIEMQMIHHRNFDKRSLFYAASTFSHQEFRGKKEWYLQLRNVYAIQFVDYSSLGKGNFRKHYCVTDKISGTDLEGITMIQIELNGLEEIDEKLRKGEKLTAPEWWYHMMANSEQFTEEEIKKCLEKGMPEQVAMGLNRLKYSGWNINDKRTYEGEIKEVLDYSDELQRKKFKGEAIGLQKGEIRGLIQRFLDEENLKKSIQRMGKHSLPEDFVQNVWNDYVEGQDIPRDKNMNNFIKILRNESILE